MSETTRPPVQDRSLQTSGRQPAQVLFRAVNAQIRRISESLDAESELDLLCECVNPGCFERLGASADEYESVRDFPTRFLVKPGHVALDSERIVEEAPGFVVVEKLDAHAESAIPLDPRRPALRGRSSDT
jgi:hypothetical protein